MKKITALLCLSVALLCGNAFAVKTIDLVPGYAVTWTFKPNVPVTLKNPLNRKIEGRCVVTVSETTPIYAVVTKKAGTINGERLSEGQNKRVFLNNGDGFVMGADPHAEVLLTNEGNNTIVAKCSA